MGQVTLAWDDERLARKTFSRRSERGGFPCRVDYPRNSGDFAFVELLLSGPMSEVQPETDAREHCGGSARTACGSRRRF